MKFKLLTLIIASIVITGCDDKVNPTQQERPPTKVTYNSIQYSPVEVTSEFKGRVSAVTEAQVRPQVTGIIQSIKVSDGQTVKKGQVLYKIDDSQYKAAYDQALASYNSVKADIDSAKLKSDRYKLLVSQKAVSKQDADDAFASYNKLVASLAERKASLDLAKINLDYTEIKAPIDGILGIASITPGALVTANQIEIINTITTLNPIYVDIAQPSAEFNKMNTMTKNLNTKEVPVKIKINGIEVANGKVNSYEYKVDESTDSIKVRSVFENKDKVLLPGMFGEVILTYGVDSNGIKIPLQSVIRDPNGSSYVYLINNENKIEKTTIKILKNTGSEAFVIDGLKVGDKVVFEGTDKIRLGDLVNPEEYKKDKEI